MNNRDVALLFHEIAAAYIALGENRFKIIAYEKAADIIENYPTEIKSVWQDGKLGDIPGIGTAIFGHLDELFKTGHVSHFESVKAQLPVGMFELLKIPGFGPKRAYLLAKKFDITTPEDALKKIEKAAKSGEIAKLEGFGEKSQSEMLKNIERVKQGFLRKNQDRISIYQADQIANELTKFLTANGAVKKVDVLGSLRRRLETIGDFDLAVVTDDPETVVELFVQYPKIQKVIERGPTGASIILDNGRQVDMRIAKKLSYGAMLQYFTGSKNHNIHLREHALQRKLSLSEYGIKKVQKTTQTSTKVAIAAYDTEEAFYKAVGLPYIVPELREDRGEVEAALTGTLPHLVELRMIKGDVHVHSDYDLKPSHDRGADSMEILRLTAENLGYEYIGISDHNPSQKNHTENQIVSIMEKRFKHIEQLKYSSKKSRVQILSMLEIDILPDGNIALPDKAFEFLDAALVSIHSSFTQDREVMTSRILKALAHPKVKIFAHPTARLIGRREPIQAHWDKIFDFCAKNNKALEINASWSRLDLPDILVQQAKKIGVKFVINTDSHDAGSMVMMRYGIDVARRGWLEARDILNTYSAKDFIKWLHSR